MTVPMKLELTDQSTAAKYNILRRLDAAYPESNEDSFVNCSVWKDLMMTM